MKYIYIISAKMYSIKCIVSIYSVCALRLRAGLCVCAILKDASFVQEE